MAQVLMTKVFGLWRALVSRAIQIAAGEAEPNGSINGPL